MKRSTKTLSIFLLGGSLCGSVLAQDAERRLFQPEDIHRIKTVGDITISPDGNTLHFLVADDRTRAVVSVPAKGGRLEWVYPTDSNQLVAEAARRHEGRLFPIYRPEALLGDLGTGSMEPPTKEELRQNARQVAEDIESLLPELGMVGMGEFIVGGFVTTALDPIEIARDMGPIMEALRPNKLPIQLPTAMSGWKGGLFNIYEPLWVDELAGNFPDVPIILTKMGRGIRTSFDICTVIAKRNANVYFDLTDSRAEHLREAIDEIGAHRIMFGTDLHGLSVNYAYEHGFHTVDGAHPSEEDREWISWRTADSVYQLGLAG